MKKQKKKIAAKTPKERQQKATAQNTDCDQDGEVSFMGDIDEDIDLTRHKMKKKIRSNT